MARSRGFLALVLVGLMGAVGCGDDQEKDPFVPPRALTADEQALVQSVNGFGFDLFREVATQAPEGDLFISPLSVSMALGMTFNGAAGETATGMREALVLGEGSVASINAAYDSLISLLTTMDPAVAMAIGNSVWYREGLAVLQPFVDALTRYFHATVSALDFAAPSAVATINAWVNAATQGKIETIIDGGIPSDTMMYLVNAIYFKGDWADQFDAANTHAATFYAPTGERSVLMMNGERTAGYFETESFQAVDLRYGHGLFGLTVLLPRPDYTVADVVAQMDATSWQTWMSELTEQELMLSLPRFELRYETSLVPVLTALGMDAAFDPQRADFSGMVDPADASLYISDVKHSTFVRVDEEGTEAAAVTAVEMGATSAPTTQMIVNRPFVVVLHDWHSQTMLFMGRIESPTAP